MCIFWNSRHNCLLLLECRRFEFFASYIVPFHIILNSPRNRWMTSTVEVNSTTKDFEIFKSQLNEKVQDRLCIWFPNMQLQPLHHMRVNEFENVGPKWIFGPNFVVCNYDHVTFWSCIASKSTYMVITQVTTVKPAAWCVRSRRKHLCPSQPLCNWGIIQL